MARFLHVTVSIPPANERVLERLFDKASDWVRYAPNCWIVVSDEDSEKWLERIREVTDKNANLFVFELNIENAYGYLPQKIWDWFEKHGLKFTLE
jgi:hypothetical protein